MPLVAQAARHVIAVLAVWCLAPFDFAAEAGEPTYSFDIPSGEAKPMLREFAAQAKREIVFAIDSVDRIQTRAVKGEMTAQAAIDQMLANTGLIAGQDARTGAFAVRRDPRSLDEKQTARKKSGDRSRDKKKALMVSLNLPPP